MRVSVPTVVAAAVVVPTLALAAPAAAQGVFVEANPSTTPAGDEIGIRASCTDNLAAATVTAAPFGTVTVAPRYGFLTATTRVRATTRAGDYRITLRCPDGRTATATLHVVARIRPAQGPATGGGGTAADGAFGGAPALLVGGGAAAIAAGVALAVAARRRRRWG